MALLQTIRGMAPGQLFPLEADTAILGRHPECDIVLDAAAVSRQHARILRVDGGYYIEDLNSRNGTLVNSRPVLQRQLLADNDEVQICDIAFVFRHTPDDARSHRDIATTLATVTMIEDEGPSDGSTIMSKLDVSTGTSGLQLQINAEGKLKAFMEIGQALVKTVGLQQVLGKVLDGLFAIFIQADRGFVILKDYETGKLIPKAVKYRRHDDAQSVRISRTIVNGVIAGREAILSADAAADSRFDMAESVIDFQIRSMMCAPLIGSDGQALGVLQIDTLDQRSRFSREDLDMLASVACQAAVAVENAQLHEAVIQDRVIERDLALALQVQRRFLPRSSPAVAGYEFFEYYEPARKLGGDYYDYVLLPDGRMGIVVADVAGKGITASLLMARVSAETRFCLASLADPAVAVARLNQFCCDNMWEDRFVTFVLVVLDPQRHEIVIVNAGHPPPLLRRGRGEVLVLGEEETGLPLGVGADTKYVSCPLALEAGDNLVLYTDGITEAMNDKNDLYGRQRLHNQLGAPVGGVRILGQRILTDVRQFVGGRSQADDMCLTCFGRTGQQ